MPSSRMLTAACVQMCSTTSVATNIDAAVRMIREAAHAGAHYIQTPEMSSIVARDRAHLFASIDVEGKDKMLAALRELAKTLKVSIHIGSLAVKVGEKIANRAFVISPSGTIIGRYDKIHLFDADLANGESWRESATYTGGDKAVIVDLPEAKLGLGICYDVRFPHLYRDLAMAGAEMITAPACFTKQTGEAHWQILQRARAIECGAFMISAAQAGLHQDGRETYGHSIIVDPWGKVLAEAGDKPGIILAQLDLAQVPATRQRLPCLKNGRDYHLAQAVSV